MVLLARALVVRARPLSPHRVLGCRARRRERVRRSFAIDLDAARLDRLRAGRHGPARGRRGAGWGGPLGTGSRRWRVAEQSDLAVKRLLGPAARSGFLALERGQRPGGRRAAGVGPRGSPSERASVCSIGRPVGSRSGRGVPAGRTDVTTRPPARQRARSRWCVQRQGPLGAGAARPVARVSSRRSMRGAALSRPPIAAHAGGAVAVRARPNPAGLRGVARGASVDARRGDAPSSRRRRPHSSRLGAVAWLARATAELDARGRRLPDRRRCRGRSTLTPQEFPRGSDRRRAGHRTARPPRSSSSARAPLNTTSAASTGSSASDRALS